jgi:hypothetical protein
MIKPSDMYTYNLCESCFINLMTAIDICRQNCNAGTINNNISIINNMSSDELKELIDENSNKNISN